MEGADGADGTILPSYPSSLSSPSAPSPPSAPSSPSSRYIRQSQYLTPMKFGKVDSVAGIDLSLPQDHVDTAGVLGGKKENPLIHVGCAKWNRSDLKGFYPRGTKDELAYYASQFNSIEMNATFYRLFPAEQFATWREKTPVGFRFFPKITQTISQFKRLKEVDEEVQRYTETVRHLEDRLGTVFLQMIQHFAPKDIDRIQRFVEIWPKDIPLAVELRHTDWYNNETVAGQLYQLLRENNVTSVLVDTAGRRDLMHMRLTTPRAFVRWVGANDPTDKTRLDEWVIRLKEWVDQGVQEIAFFIHHNQEVESPALAAHFIQALNAELSTDLKVPAILQPGPGLFG